MKLPPPKLHLAAGAAALPAMSRIAWAQAYPSRPVHWIVGFTPAGGNDIVARLMGQWLSERLGQPVVIQNRPVPGRISQPRPSRARPYVLRTPACPRRPRARRPAEAEAFQGGQTT